MAELGVQLKTTYLFGGAARVVFLDLHRLRSVIINEGITGCRVKFYMAFIVHNPPSKQVTGGSSAGGSGAVSGGGGSGQAPVLSGGDPQMILAFQVSAERLGHELFF
jgi:hypothetical protein